MHRTPEPTAIIMLGAYPNEPGSNLPIAPTGRDLWALTELVNAGNRGCTPIDNPAPRWSAYVHKLRSVYGVEIETVHEAHGGNFAGTHARYVLHSHVTLLADRRAT